MCCNHERGECGSADVDVWRLCDPLDPIKPKAVGVVWLNNLLATLLAMSLVNNRTFECSMGHRISHQDA